MNSKQKQLLKILQNWIIFSCFILQLSCAYFIREKTVKFNRVHTLAGLQGEFGEPFGVAVREGKIYVSDGERGKILRLNENGESELITDKLDTPSQIVFNKKGELIVADSGTHTIKKVYPDGRTELIAGTENKKGYQDGDARSALFNAPVGVAVFDDKIFVADTYNDRIRLITNGQVSTVAGGDQGFRDGLTAQFNTPTGLSVWTDGRILVADMENRRIRVVEQNGIVWTLTGNGNEGFSNGLLSEAEFVQPSAVTVGEFGVIYIADGDAIRVIGRRFIPVVETLAGETLGFLDGETKRSRFARPSGLAFDDRGNLFVADSENQLVRLLTAKDIGKKIGLKEFDKVQTTAEEFRKQGEPHWPYQPPDKKREIAGTLGEIRGEMKDQNSAAWFHNGLDIVGVYGETARFIRDEKVLRPNAARNFQTTRESLRMPTLGYIHIRLGRNIEQVPFEDERFHFSFDKDKKVRDVRVPRGAKFKAGEAIGSLNSFNHVHLIAGRAGREMNALNALELPGASDSRPPTIEKVSLYRENWRGFEPEQKNDRIRITGKVRIVCEAFDQMDGNAARRKLGLFKTGYQILGEDEKPLKEFLKPKWTIRFDKTPENETAKLVYASGSRSGATGETVFRYIVTNEVSGRIHRESFFDTDKLKPGKYIVRVLAADFFGNISTEDVRVEIGRVRED